MSEYIVRGRRCGCDCDQHIVSCRMMPSDVNSVEVFKFCMVMVTVVFTGRVAAEWCIQI